MTYSSNASYLFIKIPLDEGLSSLLEGKALKVQGRTSKFIIIMRKSKGFIGRKNENFRYCPI